MFIYHNTPTNPLSLAELTVISAEVGQIRTKFDLSLFIENSGQSLNAALGYKTELSDAATINQLLEHFQMLLQGIVADPDQRLSELPCLSEEERLRLPVFRNQDQAISEPNTACPEIYVAPRNPPEQQLALIWEAVLKTSPVGIHDNFFDLGGTSIAALTLLNRVQEHFGRDLSLAALFQARTVAEQAKIVRGKKRGKAWTSLVPLRVSGGRRPFFLIPGGGGGHSEFIIYDGLAHRLDAEQPVYMLAARGLDNGQVPHTKVEEMADDYLNEIRGFQPEGPYLLGGECIGGAVAFEMARQLEAKGQEVGLLVLLDTPYPSGRTWSFHHLIGPWMKRIRQHRTAVLELAPEKRWGYLKEKGKKAMRIGTAKMYPATAPLEIQLRQIGISYQKAIRHYRPAHYPGHLVLLVSEGNSSQNYVLGWETLAEQGTEIYTVPGDHLSYIKEHVHTTAEQLQAILDAAQQEKSTPHIT